MAADQLSSDLVGLTINFSYNRIPGVTLFAVRFFPRHQPTFHAKTRLNDRNHILHDATSYSWSKRPKEGLWWTVSTATLKSTQKTIRSHCARRVKHAVVEALRVRGYDRKGIRFRDEGDGDVGKIGRGTCKEEAGSGRKSLLGTMEIHPMSGLLKASYDEVKRNADATVGWIEAHQKSLSSPIRAQSRTRRSSEHAVRAMDAIDAG